ncbi:MAG TPA: hypothetical protein VEW11_05470 [Gaiellaceae bacterium]|nr:hypothetical protein [Gaiellaceae bacterium]
MNELERRLQELGGEIAYPATPRFDLAFERRPARAWSLRPLAIGFAVLLAIAAGVLALSPGARSAFLEIFHIRGATVERVETLPDVRAQRVDFGERVSREEAERRVGFELLDLDEEPDAIFVRPDGLASVVYGDPAHPRLVLSQARGAIYDGFIKKTAEQGTIIHEVTVGGEPGLYVDGPLHFVMFVDENGFISDERTYLAGTVLLWNRDELLLRLEGDLTEEEALELAESVE